MVKIVQKDDPVLRDIAREVKLEEIKTPKIKKILKDMQTALHRESDGVALAAPQIGIPMRIFIISGKIFHPDFAKSENPDEPVGGWPKDLVFINPKITKTSKEKKKVPEGCLSVRWLYGKTRRYKNATVEAYNENGEKFTRGGGGLLAQIFQHEIDHLDGVLFIDHATDIEEIIPEKING